MARKRVPMTPKAGPTMNNRKRTFSKGGASKKVRKYACGGNIKK